MQKLIETVRTKTEINLVTLALKPGLLSLVRDLNGNHVIQSCFKFLSPEDNKVFNIISSSSSPSLNLMSERVLNNNNNFFFFWCSSFWRVLRGSVPQLQLINMDVVCCNTALNTQMVRNVRTSLLK